jgi:hypothetical protein
VDCGANKEKQKCKENENCKILILQNKKRSGYMRLDECLTAEEMEIIERLKNKSRMEIDEILGELERRMSK